MVEEFCAYLGSKGRAVPEVSKRVTLDEWIIEMEKHHQLTEQASSFSKSMTGLAESMMAERLDSQQRATRDNGPCVPGWAKVMLKVCLKRWQGRFAQCPPSWGAFTLASCFALSERERKRPTPR